MQRLWYVAYGSNLSLERFRVYLRGGRPLGGARDYPGCRDPLEPADDVPVSFAGGLRFVGVSTVWGGGMAVYDADADGEVAARAYLITAEQFIDVLAQEMRLEPELDPTLSWVPEAGWRTLGPGRYQTLAHLGTREGLPMLTFTSASVRSHQLNAPAAGYLRTIALGLQEAHRWSPRVIGRYLTRFPGAAGAWSTESVERLITESAHELGPVPLS
jgi:hypothetical protein